MNNFGFISFNKVNFTGNSGTYGKKKKKKNNYLNIKGIYLELISALYLNSNFTAQNNTLASKFFIFYF